jgi:hypothetical protein
MRRRTVQDILTGIVVGCLMAAITLLALLYILAEAPLPADPAPVPPHVSTQPIAPKGHP